MNICFGALRSVLLQALQEQTKQAAETNSSETNSSAVVPETNSKMEIDFTNLGEGSEDEVLKEMRVTQGDSYDDQVAKEEAIQSVCNLHLIAKTMTTKFKQL